MRFAIVSAGLPHARYALLFSERYRTRTTLVSLPWFLMDIATYGVGLFTPIILGAIRLASDTTGPVAAEFSNAEGTAVIDVFLLLGFLLGLWVVPRFGRIHMQIVGFAGMTIGMLVLLIPQNPMTCVFSCRPDYFFNLCILRPEEPD